MIYLAKHWKAGVLRRKRGLADPRLTTREPWKSVTQSEIVHFQETTKLVTEQVWPDGLCQLFSDAEKFILSEKSSIED